MIPEAAVFVLVFAGLTWAAERPLLTELRAYVRRSDARNAVPEASSTAPASAASQAG